MRESNTRGPDDLNPSEQIITRFALVCEPFSVRGTWILWAVQRYLYRCPSSVYRWLVTADQRVINRIVRRALPHASCEEKVGREISRACAKAHNAVDPRYL